MPKPPVHSVTSILISQENPSGNKSPYFTLAEKYNFKLEFVPFVEIEEVPAAEFRKQKIAIANYSAVIFTSRNAIDHFFRIVTDLKVSLPQEMKYYCVSESIALYLQKFILYRKRKVFYGADGSKKSLLDVLSKHVGNETFLYPCSEAQDTDIISWLSKNTTAYATPIMYKVVSSNVKEELKKKHDIICVFTPGGVRSLLDNEPGFKTNGTLLACYGDSTLKTAKALGLKSEIIAPYDGCKTLVTALEKYFLAQSC